MQPPDITSTGLPIAIIGALILFDRIFSYYMRYRESRDTREYLKQITLLTERVGAIEIISKHTNKGVTQLKVQAGLPDTETT